MATEQKTKRAKATTPKGPQLTDAERGALERRIEALEKEVRELEAELEETQEALSGQDLHIRKGYICTIFDGGDGWYVGVCPALHANGQGRTHAEAAEDLDDAIDGMLEVHTAEGWEIPRPAVAEACPS